MIKVIEWTFVFDDICNIIIIMNNFQKLTLVRIIHSLIWIFYNFVVFYMLYASIANKLDIWLVICYCFVLLEGFILLIFRLTCPLTLIARRYTNDQRSNFDIFLPEWLARHTKRIYTSIVMIIVVITIFQFLR